MSSRSKVEDDALASRKRLMEFTNEDVELVRRLGAVTLAVADDIVDDLCAHLSGDPETAALLADPDRMAGVRGSQREYISGLTTGSYDAEHVADRIRIGARHEQLGIEPAWFLSAYSRYLRSVASRICEAESSDPERALAMLSAFQKLVFLDISLAIDTYLVGRERTLREAQEALCELPNPVLRLLPGLLIVPVVGRLDSRRASKFRENLLASIREARAQAVVVDLTGLPPIDAGVADHLIATASACRLMGTTTVFTGLSTDVARSLVDIGAQTGVLVTFADLQSGVEYTARLLGYEKVLINQM